MLHLSRDATMTISVEEAMEKFALLDLRGALVDFLTWLGENSALTIHQQTPILAIVSYSQL